MTTQIVLAVLGISASALVGVVALILSSAKKSGQKQAEADYEQQAAKDAKVAGAVVAERHSRDDVADRLRRAKF